VTPKKLESYLKGTPLQGQGRAFYNAGRKYRVDPKLLIAIAGAESSFGRITSGSHNPFGWGPGIDFKSWGHAIDSVAKGLRAGYLSQGLRTIPQIGSKWAPIGASNDPTNLNSNWVKNVSKFYKELGGKSVGGRGGPSQAAPAPLSPAVSPDLGAAPDLGAFAMQNLSAISQGRYDPLESLGLLGQSVSLGGTTPSEPAPKHDHDHSGSVPVRGGGITYSGQKFTHPTSGLAGYPAVDLFAKPGTPFLAPEDGQIIRHSGRGGTSGNVYGRSIYFQGKSGKTYFVTHLGTVAPKGRYRKGQRLGTVSPWSGGDPHAHVGVRG
jgi:hypothetical protein